MKKCLKKRCSLNIIENVTLPARNVVNRIHMLKKPLRLHPNWSKGVENKRSFGGYDNKHNKTGPAVDRTS